MSTEKTEDAHLMEVRGYADFSRHFRSDLMRPYEVVRLARRSEIPIVCEFVPGHGVCFAGTGEPLLPYNWWPADEPTGAVMVSVQEIEWPVASRQDRLDALQEEIEDLRIRNERLRSLVAQERRVATHQGQTNEELLSHVKAQEATLDEMVNTLAEMAKANDSLQRALGVRDDERLRMFERHEGVVMHVDGDSVVVTYSIKDEYVDQTYRKEQFIGGRLPKKGDRLAIYVHVAEVPNPQDREPTSAPSPDEQRRHRKGAIRPPREF